jgi:Flp pilus assembly protein TadD
MPARPAPAPEAPPKVVQVAPEPVIVTHPNAAPAPAAPAAPKPENSASGATYVASGVTPLPGTVLPTTAPATAAAPKPKPIQIIPPTPVNFPRYNYLSPRPPAAGDRRGAGAAFNQARLAEQEQKWSAALSGYQEAARLDPSWFEAQYNAGVIAQRLRNYAAALASYETALALQPDSVNARYNFALSLKAAGYVPDAANELKKILAVHPREARAHLALANLCAQALHDPAQAREHYLKVLELDPTNPETANIRFWLAANPAE